MIKAMLIPLALIICFGGGFVALTKPFNGRATFFIFLLAGALLLVAMASGLPKWIGVIAFIGAIIGLSFTKVKR